MLTQLEVLVCELLGQIAGLGTDNECVRDVNAELGSTGADFGLFAQDRQVGDLALQQPAGGLENPVVVALGQHDALAVVACPVQQLVLEHLRRGDRRYRDSELRNEIRAIHVPVHQRERGIDLARRSHRHPATRMRGRARGLEGAGVRLDDRQPQPDTVHQIGDARVQLEPTVQDDGRKRRKAFCHMCACHGE
ncbi:Uncharacterised protein [Mycobacteroides abscessus subsp. massiliense]|nr:Uncharacterised protein [Mycobacteroides abscessus subsp. massiliense]